MFCKKVIQQINHLIDSDDCILNGQHNKFRSCEEQER